MAHIPIVGTRTDGRGFEEKVGSMFGVKEIELQLNILHTRLHLNANN
jgi:hypothetical protein